MRADAERNRLRIIAAARELFAQRGLDVSLDWLLLGKGKMRRSRRSHTATKLPDTKRAIVTLAAGEIPLFEN